MTLIEWERKYKRYAYLSPSGFGYYMPDFVDSGNGERAELWHLSDVYVRSVTGGSIWFTPRKTT